MLELEEAFSKSPSGWFHPLFLSDLSHTTFNEPSHFLVCKHLPTIVAFFFLNSKIKMKHSLKLQCNSSSQLISKKIFCADLLKWTVNKVCSEQPEFRKVTQCADWGVEKQTRELFPRKKRRPTLSHCSSSEHWRSPFVPGWGIQPLTSLTSPLERLSCNQKCCIAWLGSIVYRIV